MFQINDRLDVIEARANVVFDLGRNWTLKNESDDGKGILRKVVIKEFGENRTAEIFILKGEHSSRALVNRTFFVGTEQDLHEIDWTSPLFRLKISSSTCL